MDVRYRCSSSLTFGQFKLKDGRMFLIPLESSRATIEALGIYHPQTPRARLAKSLFAVGLRLGIGRRLLPRVQWVAWNHPDTTRRSTTSLLLYLEKVLGRNGLRVAISCGKPGPNRKPVLQVLTSQGETLAYVKVASSRLSDTLVQREVGVLEYLARRSLHSFTSPIVLHSGRWNGRELVIQSAPMGRTKAVPRDVRLHYFDVPNELATLHTQWVPLEESDFWNDLLRRIGEISHSDHVNTLERVARKVAESLKGQPLPFHFSHGDFTSWNIKLNGEKLFVFDWEYARKAALPAHDIFHFHFQEMWFLQRRDPAKIYAEFFRAASVRSTVETHLAKLGLDKVPYTSLFFFYRLDQLVDALQGQNDRAFVRELAAFEGLLGRV
jgi:hypothetical protein